MNAMTLSAGHMPRSRLVDAYLSEIRFEFVKALRNPMFAVPTLVFPAMFYLLFGVFLGSAKGNAGMATYALTGYGVFGAMAPGLFGFGVSLAFEREQGLLVFKQALPVPAGAQLIARMVMAMLFVAIIALTLIAMAVFLAGVPLTIGQAAHLLVIDIFAVLPFAAIGLFVGASVPGQAAPAVINLIYLPMAFLSGLWMPMQFLPKFLQNLADVWPAHHFAQLSLAAVGAPSMGSTLTHVLVPLAYTLVFFVLALRKLQSGGLRLFGANARRTVVGAAVGAVVIGGVAVALARNPQAAAVASSGPATHEFAIANVRVFDGDRVIEKANVIVRNGVVVAVGPKEKIPKQMRTVDGAGKTLLPGLIDAHTHVYGATPREDALRFGVTAELDMFSDWGQIAAARRERESLAESFKADMWSAGTLITVAGGHGTEYGVRVPTLGAAGEAPAFIADRLREGSDYIKLVIEDGSRFGHKHPSLDAAQVNAVVAATHAEKTLAIAHVSTERDADIALDAKADILAHIFTDKVGAESLLTRAKAGNVCVVATLAVVDSFARAGGAQRLLADSAVEKWLSPEQRGGLKGAFPPLASTTDALDLALANVKRLHAAGVRVLAGTDAGNPGTAHGASLHQELELLVRGGLTPVEALAAATGKTADCFHIERGRIAKGTRADFVLVAGNPTEDIKATRAIEGVWKNGFPVARGAPRPAAAADATSVAPAESLISDFEDGTQAAKYGIGWADTTDGIRGGKSTVALTIVSTGVAGNKHALGISGEVSDAIAYAWSGTMFFAQHPPMQGTRDYSAKSTLSLRVRGDGRRYQVALFSGENMQAPPALREFTAGPEWREISIPLADFNADLTRVRAIAVLAGLPVGKFAFEIDDVHVR
jgi:imidazolonepropionase-like amidohydrolase/ABC-type multidrug transport system permease subunit